MNGWKRAGRGGRRRLVATLDAQEAAVLRGLVDEVRRMLDARSAEQPRDELAEITGLDTGPSTRPDDPVLARLLPDFATDDADLSGALRSLHEPELIAAKEAAAAVVLETLPGAGGRIELTPDQADAWLAALNDVRLALGTALDVNEDMPDELPPDDPRAGHLGVYHWLTYVQDGLVQSRMALLQECETRGARVRRALAAKYPGVVLVIRADLVDEIVAHARRDHPNEACGVIAGPEGTDRPERLIPMVNAAALPGYPGFHHPETGTVRFGDTFYTWESKADLLLDRELSARDETMVVIYHSHTKPGSEAYPSVIDVEIAQGHPDAHHVIVGMQDPRNPGRPEVRSYRTVGEKLVEEDVSVVQSYDVVESYMFAHTGADDVPDNR